MITEAYHYVEKPAAPDAPLLFTFHGTGGNEQQFLGLAAELLPQAHVISPRGDVSEHGALRFFKRMGEGVYDMADLATRTQKLAVFMAAHCERLKPSKVVALGYSNGANILASVMFSHAELVNDAILMHPLIPFRPPANAGLAQVRVLVTAGKRDPICPPSMTQALVDCIRAQGGEVVEHWHEGGHELRPSEVEAASQFLNP